MKKYDYNSLKERVAIIEEATKKFHMELDAIACVMAEMFIEGFDEDSYLHIVQDLSDKEFSVNYYTGLYNDAAIEAYKAALETGDWRHILRVATLISEEDVVAKINKWKQE